MKRLRDEDGYVVALAMVGLLVGILLAGAVVTQVTSTESSVRRDSSSKRALQAARAGVEQATQLVIATAKTSWTTPSQSCPTRNSDGSISYTSLTYTATAATPSAWCPAITGRKVGASESFSYQISAPYTPPSGTTTARDVIATGTVGIGTAAARRVRQTISSVTVFNNPFTKAEVTGGNLVYVDNNSNIGDDGTIRVRSGGDITLKANNSSSICGTAQPGAGKTTSWTNASKGCGGTVLPGAMLGPLGEVTIPPPAANGQYGDNGQLASLPGVTWDAGTLALSINANVTLTGNTYVFCTLNVASNSTVTFKKVTNDPISIFFKRPEDCAGTPPVPFTINSNVAFVTDSNAPIEAQIQGSTSKPSDVTFSSNVSAAFGQIYAPHSILTISQNSTYRGLILGQTIRVDSNSHLLKYVGAPGDLPPGQGVSEQTYKPSTFVECSSSGGTQDLTGC